jgi:hypothetical protein
MLFYIFFLQTGTGSYSTPTGAPAELTLVQVPIPLMTPLGKKMDRISGEPKFRLMKMLAV